MRRAQKGDESVLPQLRRMLDHLDKQNGRRFIVLDLADNAIRSLLKKMYQTDLLSAELSRRELRNLREHIQGPEPSPLEELLAERICACWLRVQFVEISHAQSTGGLTIKQEECHQDLIDRANRRYLAAVKTLAQVRKLLAPCVQVNIAEKQVNFVGAPTAGDTAGKPLNP